MTFGVIINYLKKFKFSILYIELWTNFITTYKPSVLLCMKTFLYRLDVEKKEVYLTAKTTQSSKWNLFMKLNPKV